ncbi:hypothetical protein COO91_09207 (plasmid) [Nostoc flagelliforme CCNUN1]|uniref:Uncharacterized protein n=1 Tax=Nostoc flagelliforme CCNUN1 TaxID=2038116 RepID=A0A2K8T5W2_9NOSO|nr:hypothetical protein COO91_09207 [Nostoc flagelliforme CCNUN1]
MSIKPYFPTFSLTGDNIDNAAAPNTCYIQSQIGCFGL